MIRITSNYSSDNCLLFINMIPRKNFYCFFVYVLAVVFIEGMGCDPLNAQPPQQINKARDEAEILQSWQGDYPVAKLNLLPEKQRNLPVGFITDTLTFESVWETFQPGISVPEIDFETNLVLYVRNTQFYNRISIGKVQVKNGVAEVLAMETLSAMPIEDKVAISMVLVERRNIRAVRTSEGTLPVPD